MVLQQLFEEYGAVLARRPWEVHLLDLEQIFGRHTNLYRTHGEIPLRDHTLRIDGYKPPRSPRAKVAPCYQLQQDLAQGRWSGLNRIFLIHDERRKLYFWGDQFPGEAHPSLFVQNATIGQRLPPAKDLSMRLGPHDNFSCFATSPNGRYIAIVYESFFNSDDVFVSKELTLV